MGGARRIGERGSGKGGRVAEWSCGQGGRVGEGVVVEVEGLVAMAVGDMLEGFQCRMGLSGDRE